MRPRAKSPLQIELYKNMSFGINGMIEGLCGKIAIQQWGFCGWH
jgi:hypothetical protein